VLLVTAVLIRHSIQALFPRLHAPLLCVCACALQVFLSPTHLCLVLEYAPGGTLLGHVMQRDKLSEDDARWFFQQLIVTVDCTC
jgi:serine/threonine protein kinase